MNVRIFFASCLGCMLITAMYYLAPVNLFSTWQYIFAISSMVEVTIACFYLRFWAPKFIHKAGGITFFRWFFTFHANLYAFSAGIGVSHLLVSVEGAAYGNTLTAALLFGCAVAVSTFAFDLRMCAMYLVSMLGPVIYTSFFVAPNLFTAGLVAVMSVLFFVYLATSMHLAEIGSLEQEETIKRQAGELRESLETIAASNNLFQNTINNISEIFLTLDRNGNCFGNISERAEGVLGQNPTGKHFTEILHLESKAYQDAVKWFEVIVERPNFFANLVSLGPSEWVDTTRGFTFRVQYFPIMSEGNLKALIMTLSDVTNQLRSQREAQDSEARANMVLAASENRQLFAAFLRQVPTYFGELAKWKDGDVKLLRQQLHTMKGTAGIYQVRALSVQINALEVKIKEVANNSDALAELLKNECPRILEDFHKWITSESRTFKRLRVFEPEEVTFTAHQANLVKRSFAESNEIHVSFDQLIARLKAPHLDKTLSVYEAVVQKVAKRLSKKVRFELTASPQFALLLGDDYISIVKSMVHLFNNAVDHGIEAPNARLLAGKSEEGFIRVSVRHDEESVWIDVEDDGAGIDVAQLRMRLVERGSDISKFSDADVLRSIFDAGLTTREKTTDISGHGMGLSALIEDVHKNRGQIDVKSEFGRGTKFILRLPRDPAKILFVDATESADAQSATVTRIA